MGAAHFFGKKRQARGNFTPAAVYATLFCRNTSPPEGGKRRAIAAMTRDEIRPVALRDVQVADGFFSRYADLVREEVIPYQWEALNDRIPGAEKSGCLRNFRIAAGQEAGEFTGMVFQDSDIGKWLEAVAYSLTTHPDAALERTADEVIELLEAAQREDGYLDTYFIVKDPKNRWKCLRDCHELYCAGHLLEGAVAYWQATGKDRFLNVMRRYVDYIATVFGRGEGQMRGYPGHEEIELALCKLYDVTGEKKYLDLAAYFIDERGRDPKYFLEELKTRGDAFHWEGNDAQGMDYFQSHAPVREQTEAVGHAVRAVYLYSGMADVAMRTGDEGLLEACRRLYRNIADKRLYVTGAIGSTYIGEAFTFDYDLPNDTAYAETCASVGLIFFMKRMLEADGAAEYGDMMERALYNTVLAGMAMDGKSFFYVNPLEVFPEADEKDPSKRHVKTVRQKWFACACCPPNVARLLADLGSYIYRRKGSAVTTDLFIGSRLALPGGAELIQTSEVPFGGKVTFTLRGAAQGFSLRVRCPEWAEGVTCTAPCRKENGYIAIQKDWQDGDSVTLVFGMEPRRIYANPLVRQDAGKVCLMRGPLVYCLEEADNGANLHLLRLPEGEPVEAVRGEGALFGMTLLRAKGRRFVPHGSRLYAPDRQGREEEARLTFVPYFAWGNRDKGEMAVYVRE